MQQQYGFVVLNYKNYHETLACVASILAIPGDDYAVVVVDNASPNESFDHLHAVYDGHAKVTVLASGANGGYSFGNNTGIAYLATRGIHKVFIATSDTLVISTDILDQVSMLDRGEVGVIGPRVKNLVGHMQNPMLERVNASYIINIFLPLLAALCRRVVYAVRDLFRHQNAASAPKITADNGEVQPRDVYMIHGCFLYLSSEYLRRCGPLDDALFMYGEEDLLAFNAYANGLRTIYAPGIQVIHKDAMSTPKENNNQFFTINSKKSMAYLRSRIRLIVLLKQPFSNGGIR
jgi:GT2 family glycosyltransferase